MPQTKREKAIHANNSKLKKLPMSEISDNGYSINERLVGEKNGLNDEDRRLDIALGRMGAITTRVKELDEERNITLRKQYLENEIKNNPRLAKPLQKELDKIKHDNPHSDETYREVVQGYKSMSTRKNQLEEPRNHYVKQIEELKAIKAGKMRFSDKYDYLKR